MSNLLTKICEVKRKAIAKRKVKRSLSELESDAKDAPPVRDFSAALDRRVQCGGYALIAELKKASPSAGLIRTDFNPSELAQSYEAGGAACLSVLTEEDHFKGRDDYLRMVRKSSNCPVLRKDFMLDPYQIIESRAIGADCILLILAVLDDIQAAELESCANDYELEVLIEVHNESELDRALTLKSKLIGINNRNLENLEVDISTTERLLPQLPKEKSVVTESGLRARADLERLAAFGAKRFLIGEHLMRQPDVEQATRNLLNSPMKEGVQASVAPNG